MPLYQHKNISNEHDLVIWKITESLSDLLNLSSELLYQVIIPEVKSESRIKQWLSTRILLHQLLPGVEIVYTKTGKPILNNGMSISISHTHKYVAVLVSDKECGIDIEKPDQKIERIKHKFLSADDISKLNSTEALTVYWCAKEALYKYYGEKELLFIEHLFIEGYSPDSSFFNGRINIPGYTKELKMIWEKLDDHFLVYTL